MVQGLASGVVAAPGRISTEEGMIEGDRPSHELELAAQMAVEIRLEQIGVDLDATFRGPSGEVFRPSVDTPTGSGGTEFLWWVTDEAGAYRLELRSLVGSGPYRLELRTAPADDRDRRRMMAQTAYYRGIEAQGSGNHRAAAEALGRAVELWSSTENQWHRGSSLVAQGWSVLAIGELESAGRCFAEAHLLAEELEDFRLAARSSNGWGVALRRMGFFGAAEERLQGALESARRGEVVFEEARALVNLATVFFWRGQAEEALVRYEEGLSLWHRLGDRFEIASTLHNMASTFLLLERWPEALDTLARAHRLVWGSGVASHRELLAQILVTTGWLHYLRGAPQTALRFYRLAAGSAAEVPGSLVAGLYDRMGSAYRRLGQWSAAEQSYGRSLERLEHDGPSLALAHTLANICRLHFEGGEEVSAPGRSTTSPGLPPFQSACDRARASFEAMGDLDGLATLDYLEGQIAYARGDLHRARARLEAAIGHLESLWTGLATPRYRNTFLAGWSDYYALYLDVLLDLRRAEGPESWDAAVLELIERTRARALVSMLAETHIELETGAVEPLERSRRQLGQKIWEVRARRMQLSTLPDRPRALMDLEEELRALRERGDRLERQIRRASPEYAAMVRPRPLDVAGALDLLDSQTLFVVFALGERRSVLAVLGSDGYEVHEIPPRRELERLGRGWLDHLARPSNRWAADQRRRLAHELSDRLLTPVAGRLENRRLVFLGDGVLRYLPLHALPRPASEDDSPLVEHHEVTYLPSFSTLAMLRRRNRGVTLFKGDVAVVPGPDAVERLESEGAEAQGFWPREPLVHAWHESRAILGLAPNGGSLFGASLGSRQALLGGGLKGYSIIHFATHGVVDSQWPERSGLFVGVRPEVVAGEGKSAELLDLGDIFQLELDAELVVLSACRTALGEEVRGEGMIGLTRAFMYAGASRLLVSLWDVDDEATSELMTRFYGALWQGGKSPAAALRTAQSSMAREARWQPYHWAGFVLQGDWQDIERRENEPRQ